MKLQLLGLTESEQLAIEEVVFELNIQLASDGIPVHFLAWNDGIHITYDGEAAVIHYETGAQLIRAFGLLVEQINKGAPVSIKENPCYQALGVMIDCSRNAVLHIDSFKTIIKKLALMGYTTVQLYTEDTYEMKQYPYFGYLRGRYHSDEWKVMDDYAALLGIELVPCIQTLAHLAAVLKWSSHSDMLDCNDILLIDEPKTYVLIEEMFRTMANSLRSRNINIGMDEAHMLGLGKYLDKHGFQDRSTLMMKHFNKVMDIARSYGYKPMMWSDMFFRLASNGEYYDADSPIREDVASLIPDDLKLVYWDYYSEDKEKYEAMLKKHKQLSEHIVFAGGAWKWMGFTPNNAFSRHIGRLAHESCISSGVQEVLITAWGDNGAECSLYSVLPTLQLWAELCYKNSEDEALLEERFATCAGGSYTDFMALDLANLVPDNPAPGISMGNQVNPNKYLLYQDVLYGLFDQHVQPHSYKQHYAQSKDRLLQAMERNPNWKGLFETQATLCGILELKASAGIDIRDAYRSGNTTQLQQYAEQLLPEIRERVKKFIKCYRKQWMNENKVFGLDVFDLRIGGLLQRIDAAIERLEQYVNGDIERLDELEQQILSYDGREDCDQKVISAAQWHLIATPSVITGI